MKQQYINIYLEALNTGIVISPKAKRAELFFNILSIFISIAGGVAALWFIGVPCVFISTVVITVIINSLLFRVYNGSMAKRIEKEKSIVLPRYKFFSSGGMFTNLKYELQKEYFTNHFKLTISDVAKLDELIKACHNDASRFKNTSTIKSAGFALLTAPIWVKFIDVFFNLPESFNKENLILLGCLVVMIVFCVCFINVVLKQAVQEIFFGKRNKLLSFCRFLEDVRLDLILKNQTT